MTLFFALGVIGVALVVDLLLSVVLKSMWVWFVTPAFGIAAPGIAMIFGMLLMISLVKGMKTNFDWDELPKAFINRFVGIFVIWGIGWIVHLFV